MTQKPTYEELEQRVKELEEKVKRLTEAEDASRLRYSESFINSIIDQSPHPMWISDDKGTLIRLNRACCDLLNIQDHEVVGKYNVLNDNIVEKQGFMPLVRSVYEEGKTVQFLMEYDSSLLKHLDLKKTAFVILEVTVFPIKDDTGGVTNAVIQHKNLTKEKLAENALKKNQALLEETQRLSKLGGWELDVESGRITWTDEVYRIYGVSPDYDPGDIPSDMSFYKPSSRSILKEAFQKALDKGEPYDLELEFTNVRGEDLWVRTVGNPILRQGKVIRISGNIMDITERKRAEEALREGEARFKAQYHGSPFPIFTWCKNREDFVLADYNASAESITNGKVREFLGRRATEMYKHRQDILQDLRRCVVEQGVIRREMISKHFVPGRLIVVTYAFVPPDLVMVHLEDITDLKQAEEELRQSEERFRSIFEKANVGMVTTTPQGDFLNANPTFCKLLEYTEAEILKMKVFEITHPDDLPETQRQFSELIAGHRQVINLEKRYFKKDGGIIWAHTTGTWFFDSNLKPIYGVGIIQDITERKQAEETLRESEKRLRFLTSQLLSAQEDERRRISMELHDEMGQALTAIQFNLAELEKGIASGLAPAIKETLEETRSIVEQASEQIRELSLHLRPSMLDDLGLVPTLRWYLNRFSKRTNIEVKFEAMDLDARLDHNIETILYRIVQEALTNIARHAEAKKGMVSLHRKGEVVAVFIEDDGKGFDVNEILKREAPEAGMGLIGMKERASIIGGSLTVESRKGHGTRISLEIPL